MDAQKRSKISCLIPTRKAEQTNQKKASLFKKHKKKNNPKPKPTQQKKINIFWVTEKSKWRKSGWREEGKKNTHQARKCSEVKISKKK